MLDTGAIAEQVVAGVIVLVVGGAGALLFRFLSRRISVVGNLWRRVSAIRGVPKALFLAGIVCMFLGFIVPSDNLGSGGLFLVAASGFYALIFREPRQQPQPLERQQNVPAPSAPSPRTSNSRTRPTKPATNTNGAPVVGETVALKTGSELTVHSYESPVPPPEYTEPDPGREYSAIEVEWCAGSDSRETLENVQTHYFELQMPNYTRIRDDIGVREPALHNTVLPVGDCVRGWITFQTPQGERPSFVVFSDHDTVVKWAI